MTAVRIRTAKPPLPGADIEFYQGGELVAEGVLDGDGSYIAEVELDEGVEVEVRVADHLKTHQIPRDLGNLRFCPTREKPKLTLEEATRRWKRKMAKLPPDWLDESLPKDTLDERKDAIGRAAFGGE